MYKHLRNEIRRNIGFQTKLALLTYRIGNIGIYYTENKFEKKILKLLYYSLKFMSMILNCGEIPNPSIKIGWGLILQHGFSSTQINPNVEIGKNCVMFHNVTLGISQRGKCKIIIGDNVTLGAYSMVLGETTLGNNCKVGARTIVIDRNIPDNSTIVNPLEYKVITNNQ